MNQWEFMDKEYIWHPFTQMKGWNENKQLVIDHGEGVKLYDVEGNAYYDGISSLWVNIHGHRRWEIDEAVKKQLDKIAHTTLLGLINKPSAELAKKLVEVTPKGLNKVFYSDDGSTAVEAAVKIAFQYWQHKGLPEKQQFINLGDSYHGDTVTDEIYNTFLGEAAEYKTFYHGHSYTGNPLACAAGVAGLELFEKDDVIENLPPKMAVIAEHIQKMNTMKYVGNARQCGMLAGIELMHDKNLKIPFDSTLLMAGGICQTARKYGLIVRNIGDVIIFMPPLVSTVQQIEEMLSILEQAMQEVFEKVDLHSNIKFSDPCAF